MNNIISSIILFSSELESLPVVFIQIWSRERTSSNSSVCMDLFMELLISRDKAMDSFSLNKKKMQLMLLPISITFIFMK